MEYRRASWKALDFVKDLNELVCPESCLSVIRES